MLRKSAYLMTLNHFNDIAKTNQFEQIEVDLLVTLLKDDELNVPEEEDAFNALIKWMKHDVVDRKQHFGDLCCHVRYKYIDWNKVRYAVM